MIQLSAEGYLARDIVDYARAHDLPRGVAWDYWPGSGWGEGQTQEGGWLIATEEVIASIKFNPIIPIIFGDFGSQCAISPILPDDRRTPFGRWVEALAGTEHND